MGSTTMKSGSVTTPPKSENKQKAKHGTLPGPSGWSTFWYYDPNSDALVFKQKKVGYARRRFAVAYVKFQSKDRFPQSIYNVRSNVYGQRWWGMGKFYKMGDWSLWKL